MSLTFYARFLSLWVDAIVTKWMNILRMLKRGSKRSTTVAAMAMVCTALVLTGCAPTSNNVTASSSVSNTIFLESSDYRDAGNLHNRVFLKIRTRSPVDAQELRNSVAGRLIAQGYDIVSSPKDAGLILDVAIRRVELNPVVRPLSAREYADNGGKNVVKGAVVGALIGTAIGAVAGGGRGALIGLGAGTGIGAIGGAADRPQGSYEDAFFAWADVVISERIDGDIVPSTSEEITGTSKSGKSLTRRTKTEITNGKFLRHQTEVVAMASAPYVHDPVVIDELIEEISESIVSLM